MNFHLQKSLKFFEKKISWLNLIKKGQGIKVSPPLPNRVNASFFRLFQVFLGCVRVSYSLHIVGSDATISGYFLKKSRCSDRISIIRSIKCIIYLNWILVQFPIVNFKVKFERWIWYLHCRINVFKRKKRNLNRKTPHYS